MYICLVLPITLASILLMNKQRHRVVDSFAQSHTASKQHRRI
jgi:hypothetical protein